MISTRLDSPTLLDKKRYLENAIHELISQFSLETGLVVEKVEVQCYESSPRTIVGYTLTVKVRL